MTTEEHLQKIKAKCEQLLAMSPYQLQPEAGWRSTIAAIDGLLANSTGKVEFGHFYDAGDIALQNIITAWPEELL